MKEEKSSTPAEIPLVDPPTSRFTRSKLPADYGTSRNDDAAGVLVRSQSSRYSRSRIPTAPDASRGSQSRSHRSLSTIIFLIQCGCIFLFIFGSVYSTELYSPLEYIIFRDIMAMLIIGFGYLMTFLRKYGLGAVGFTLMLTALGMQISIFMEHFVHFMYYPDNTPFPLPLTLAKVIDAEFFVAALLITYGAVIGRASPFQLVMIMLSESFFYAINKVMLVLGELGAEDVGGTITIHMFGAYFGIALSKALGQRDHRSGNADSNRFGDVVAFLGTTVLWLFWPSFVGGVSNTIRTSELSL
jgi:ammonium transporter Rh